MSINGEEQIEQLRKDRDQLLLNLSDYVCHHYSALDGKCENVVPPGAKRIFDERYVEIELLRTRSDLDQEQIWRE